MAPTLDLYDHSHEDEAPAPAPRAYLGLAFGLIFEAIAGLVYVFGRAIVHFIAHF
jgi:hypothetical protein